jgi:histidyl-tRNA synthetase
MSKQNYVAWAYNTPTFETAELFMEEINDMLEKHNLKLDYYFDDDQEEWDYKIVMEIEKGK